MAVTIRRRKLLAALGGGAAAWPLAAWAQQPELIRRIIVLMGIANDAEAQARAMALREGLVATFFGGGWPYANTCRGRSQSIRIVLSMTTRTPCSIGERLS